MKTAAEIAQALNDENRHLPVGGDHKLSLYSEVLPEQLQQWACEIYQQACRDATKVVLGGRFLHEEAPDALFAKAVNLALLRMRDSKKPSDF